MLGTAGAGLVPQGLSPAPRPSQGRGWGNGSPREVAGDALQRGRAGDPGAQVALTTEGPHPAQHDPAMTRAHQGGAGRWPGLPHCRETYGAIGWAELRAQHPGCSAWGGRDGSAQGGRGLSPVHLHARPLGEGEHPAAPQFWGTSPLPHGSWLRGTSPLPYLPWFGGDFPAAPGAVTGVGMFPLSHIPWLGGDFPAAPCPMAWWGCPCCPMSHDSVGMPPLPHIPCPGGDIPAAQCPMTWWGHPHCLMSHGLWGTPQLPCSPTMAAAWHDTALLPPQGRVPLQGGGSGRVPGCTPPSPRCPHPQGKSGPRGAPVH